MRRSLLATTAFASLLAFGAIAQEAADPAAPATEAPAEVMPADPAVPALPEADAAADETMPAEPAHTIPAAGSAGAGRLAGHGHRAGSGGAGRCPARSGRDDHRSRAGADAGRDRRHLGGRS